MATVGLIVNPAAGRDVRRLAGSAVVSDNYAKSRTAAAVLAGLSIGGQDVSVWAMPDRAGLAAEVIEEGDEEMAIDAQLLDIPVRGDREDTREAAARFAETADVVVVLGGDGTIRDVALEVGDVPIAAVSTGTNNVVPTHIDGTVAGAAAGFVATADSRDASLTTAHDMIDVVIEEPDRRRSVRALATAGIVDRPFVGTRAILHGTDFLGGVVSRAAPGDIGLSGIAGALTTHAPDDPGGVMVRLGSPDETARAVRCVPVPGVVERVGIRDWDRLADGQDGMFDVPEHVVSVDGERDIAVTDAIVRMRPINAGPRIVRFADAMAAARNAGYFEG